MMTTMRTSNGTKNYNRDGSIVVSTTNHHYGKMTHIGGGVNDVSLLKRGSVFHMNDTKLQKSGDKLRHPYMIVQDMYVDTTRYIHCVGITSSPCFIDMIPICMNNAISYINPHVIYRYDVDTFKSDCYIGTVNDTELIDLVTYMHAIELGIRTDKSITDIHSMYYDYLDAFFDRAGHLPEYRSINKQLNGYTSSLELMVSFDKPYNTVIEEAKDDVLPEKEIIETETKEDVVSKEDKVPMIPKEKSTKKPRKKYQHRQKFDPSKKRLVVDCKDPDIIHHINGLISAGGGVKLPRLNVISEIEAKSFLILINRTSQKTASQIFGLSLCNVAYRKSSIEKKFNVEYVNL